MRISQGGRLVCVLAGLAFLLGSGPSYAITYNINIVEGANSVAGTITTNGTLGNLSSADITQWNLVVNAGLGGSITLGTNPIMSGAPLLAASTSLVFSPEGGSAFFGDGFVFWNLLDSLTFPPAGAMEFHETKAGEVGDNTVLLSLGLDGHSDVQIGYAVPATTPLPAALPFFATGLGALGLLGWRRKRKAAAIAA